MKIFKWKETWRLLILVETFSAIKKFGINPLKAKVFLQHIQNLNADLTKTRVCNNQEC